MTKKERKVTLKQLRAGKGKKQQDIANALKSMGRDASQSYVSQIERGDQSPTAELAIDLAKAYEVDIIQMLLALGLDLAGVLPNDHEQN
jgi:transcriptional regulator with XRE-family HTH domain